MPFMRRGQRDPGADIPARASKSACELVRGLNGTNWAQLRPVQSARFVDTGRVPFSWSPER